MAQDTKTLKALDRAKYGLAAGIFTQQGDSEGADIALRKVQYDNTDIANRVFAQTAYASKQSIATASNMFATEIQKQIRTLNVSSLPELYKNALGRASKADQAKISGIFKGYKGTVKEIDRQLHEVGNVLRDPSLYSDSEVQAAQATQASHAKLTNARNLLSSMYTRNLVSDISVELDDKGLAQLAQSA